MQTIGERVKKLRNEKGLTQTEFGNKSSESITKNPAPEFTPIVLGLARALFITL